MRMATRGWLLAALSWLIVGCGAAGAIDSRAGEDYSTISIAGPNNVEALHAAEQGRLGRPTVVFFHATWCDICAKANPDVLSLEESYLDEIAVIRVDIDEESARGAVDRYAVRATPTFILLSGDGNVLASVPGWPGRDGLESTIRQMLSFEREARR